MIAPLLILLALTVSEPPIVKGTGLPPPGTDEAAVMAPIRELLHGLEVSDPAPILAATIPDGAITATRTAPEGTHQRRTLRWAEFAAQFKPDGKRVVESLGQPAIELDDDVAMVWAPYTVTIDGKLSHCGYDHFDLVRTDGRWKILNVTYSHRTTGCDVQ